MASPVRSLRRKKELFYSVVWPALADEGWTKIGEEESMNGKPIFVPKVLELKEGQKGEDFYDDEQLVISRLLERRNEVESSIADSYLAKVGVSPAATPLGNGKNHAGLEQIQDQVKDQEMSGVEGGAGQEVPDDDVIASDSMDIDESDVNLQPQGPRVLMSEKSDESGINAEYTGGSDGMEEPQNVASGDPHRNKEDEGLTDQGNLEQRSKNNGGAVFSDALAAEHEDQDQGAPDSTVGGKAQRDKVDENSIGGQHQQREPHASLFQTKSSSQDEQSETERLDDPEGAQLSSKEDTAAGYENEEKGSRRPRRAKRKANVKLSTGNRNSGASARDASDRDSSDFQSSEEESLEGRKRNRKAKAPPPASLVSHGRSRGRPRGRPSRKPRGRPKREDRDKSSFKRSPTPPSRAKRGASQQDKAMIDLSWKNGGKNFPTKVSQVGPAYNATEIEAAGTWQEDASKLYCDQIWDPKIAEEKLNGESMDFLASKNIPHNKRELAMIALAEMDYDRTKFDEDHVVESITTRDGRDWSDDDRRKYHLEIFRARKDIREVARVTGKSINSCLAYYLGTFKSSDDYRLLKEVRNEERLRQMMESDRDLDACVICDDGGNLLICDGCEGEYHMECLRPALQRVPDGKWECDECVDRAFIAAQDSLIRNTKLFKRVRKGSIGSDDQTKGEPAEGSGTVLMRPASPVIDIMRRLAQNISAVFSDGNVDAGS